MPMVMSNSGSVDNFIEVFLDFDNSQAREQDNIEDRIAEARAEGYKEGTGELERSIAEAKAEGFRIANDDIVRRIANAEGKAFDQGYDRGVASGRSEIRRSICPIYNKLEREPVYEVILTCPLVDTNGQ